MAMESAESSFLVLYRQEFSAISAGNHVNVLGINDVVTVEKVDFSGFYDVLASYSDLIAISGSTATARRAGT